MKIRQHLHRYRRPTVNWYEESGQTWIESWNDVFFLDRTHEEHMLLVRRNPYAKAPSPIDVQIWELPVNPMTISSMSVSSSQEPEGIVEAWYYPHPNHISHPLPPFLANDDGWNEVIHFTNNEMRVEALHEYMYQISGIPYDVRNEIMKCLFKDLTSRHPHLVHTVPILSRYN